MKRRGLLVEHVRGEYVACVRLWRQGLGESVWGVGQVGVGGDLDLDSKRRIGSGGLDGCLELVRDACVG